MSEKSKYIDKNGSFTCTKINGTKEEISKLIYKYRETDFFKNMTQSQQIIMEKIVFPSILETGMAPTGLLLEIVMPSVPEGKKFSDLNPGYKITFNLPSRFIINYNEHKN